jgi:hypothetical protein
MFSVVTISRDRPESFRNHLQSLKNQIMPPDDYWELIVLDDSTVGDDRQEAVIKEVCKEMPCQVQAYRALDRQQYGGEGRTINFGVKQTSGNPIFVLCGDDVYPTFHLYMLTTIWKRWEDGGMPKRILNWPLYHLKPFVALNPEAVKAKLIDGIPEYTQASLAQRQDRFPTAEPGLDVVDSLVDDRACYSREFLFDIKGWPEWEGCWWRDSWFTSISDLHGYRFHCQWASWSCHQWHQHRPSPGNAAAREYYDLHAGKDLVSNHGEWGNQKIRDIRLD